MRVNFTDLRVKFAKLSVKFTELSVNFKIFCENAEFLKPLKMKFTNFSKICVATQKS